MHHPIAPISLEMRRKAQGESRQDRAGPFTHSWLHDSTADSFGDGEEGQRPALNLCSSSSGTVLKRCIERGELVRLHLTCPKRQRQPESYI